MATDQEKQQVVEALMALAGERPWDRITLPEIAARAGIGFAELRGLFSGRIAILEAFAAGIDAKVIEGVDPQMAGEPGRDRLFDVVMRRLDLLAPYKAGIAGLARAACGDPGLALHLARIGLVSQHWMLAAAGIENTSTLGRLKAKGLGLAYADVLKVWLDEDDAGLPRTMKALDRSLERGEKAIDKLERACARVAPFVRACRPGKRSRPEPDAEPQVDAA